MTITDPVTGVANAVDPSTIPGYFGTFTCETTDPSITDCNMHSMGMTEDGSFTYEFSPNANLLDTTGIPSNDETSTFNLRRAAQRRADVAAGRSLQGNSFDVFGELGEDGNAIEKAPSIRNPAMCIKQNDIVFFNVNVDTLSYPTYFKDSELNNNDEFDSAPFTDLEKNILDGV